MAFGLDPGKLGFKLGDVLVGLKSGTTDVPEAVKTNEGKIHALQYLWNPDTLSYVVATSGGAGVGAEVFVTNLSGTDEALRMDVASSTITYVGKAPPGSAEADPVWKISRLTSTSGGNLTIEYAAGAATYTAAWTGHAALSYS